MAAVSSTDTRVHINNSSSVVSKATTKAFIWKIEDLTANHMRRIEDIFQDFRRIPWKQKIETYPPLRQRIKSFFQYGMVGMGLTSSTFSMPIAGLASLPNYALYKHGFWSKKLHVLPVGIFVSGGAIGDVFFWKSNIEEGHLSDRITLVAIAATIGFISGAAYGASKDKKIEIPHATFVNQKETLFKHYEDISHIFEDLEEGFAQLSVDPSISIRNRAALKTSLLALEKQFKKEHQLLIGEMNHHLKYLNPELPVYREHQELIENLEKKFSDIIGQEPKQERKGESKLATINEEQDIDVKIVTGTDVKESNWEEFCRLHAPTS